MPSRMRSRPKLNSLSGSSARSKTPASRGKRRRKSGFSGLLDEQYVNHNRFAAPGKDGSVAVFADFFAAFEDFRAEVDDIVEDGDTLVGRFTYRGRHTWASRQAAPKSSCTRSTSGGSATAGCRSTGTN